MSQSTVSDSMPTALDRLSHVNTGDASQACHADVYHPAGGGGRSGDASATSGASKTTDGGAQPQHKDAGQSAAAQHNDASQDAPPAHRDGGSDASASSAKSESGASAKSEKAADGRAESTASAKSVLPNLEIIHKEQSSSSADNRAASHLHLPPPESLE